MSKFDVKTARDKFPALNQSQVFFDNAGGSQTLGTVIEDIQQYLSKTNVQLGASYNVGKKSTAIYDEGYEAAAKYINAAPHEIVLGSSTTQLFRNLSFALTFPPGSEIIVSKIDHEANIAPWAHLASTRNLVLKWWSPTPSPNPKLLASDLKALLSPKTKLVTCTQASNILGTIHDIKAIASTVHEIPGALLCVDAVAYAPHRLIDVKELGVDYYSFSWYKVYGPHISILYASPSGLQAITSMGHYFNRHESLQDKLGFAGSCYELTASIPSILRYFGEGVSLRESWEEIEGHEGVLQGLLLGYLNGRGDVDVIGEKDPDTKGRVSTISFLVKGWKSRDVVEAVDKASKGEMGIRWGSFYSNRLVEEVLGLDGDGVVRVSMVHYNTVDEVNRLIGLFDEVLGKV